MSPSAHPTARFSDRVTHYVRYRPGYPGALVELLQHEIGFSPSSPVADVGSGTGISSELLLRIGCTVYAVEPNAEMRQAAEARFGGDPRFHSIDATAEATTLPDASVDGVIAGQAFHWFDASLARAEFARILRPGGRVVLFWNVRRTAASPFLRAYEGLLQRFGTDYREVTHRNVDEAALRDLYGGVYETRVFPNEQAFDLEGLRGRLLSSSYVPGPGHPGHGPLLAALERVFHEHEEGGSVRFEYDTELFYGPVSPGS